MPSVPYKLVIDAEVDMRGPSAPVPPTEIVAIGLRHWLRMDDPDLAVGGGVVNFWPDRLSPLTASP